jgi:hypothetical protein
VVTERTVTDLETTALDTLQWFGETAGMHSRVEDAAIAVRELARRPQTAIEKLDACLNDDRAWDGEELVALMEEVRAVLAGEAA